MTTEETIRQNRKDYVEALRDRGNIQISNALRDEEGHMCAVGLMCELSGKGEWRPLVLKGEGECVEYGYPEEYLYYHKEGENDRKNSKVPVSVLKHYGHTSDIIDWLIDLNDECEMSFMDIANLYSNRFDLT